MISILSNNDDHDNDNGNDYIDSDNYGDSGNSLWW